MLLGSMLGKRQLKNDYKVPCGVLLHTNSVNYSGQCTPPPAPLSTGMNVIDLTPNFVFGMVHSWRGRKE